MYIGPADIAPEEIKIAAGYLDPYTGTMQEVIKFKNKYTKQQYLTITRMDQKGPDDPISDEPINVRF